MHDLRSTRLMASQVAFFQIIQLVRLQTSSENVIEYFYNL